MPESAELGPTTVAVEVDGLLSNEMAFTVTARQPNGRVLWTFEADTDNLWYRPALAPDGRLYLHSSEGFVYALSPDGGLLWTSQVVTWPYVPPMSGPSGDLYLGSIATNYALSPDGQLRWKFNDPNAQGMQVAMTPGPDGRLYGAFDLGMGAFALDPLDGQLQWSNTGVPPMIDIGNPFGTEVAFGPSGPGQPVDQMYVHMDFHRVLNAFSLDGDQLFTTSVGGSISHQPVVGSDGTIYVPTFGASAGWGFEAIEPKNGQILWIYDPENGNGISELEIGTDDTLYFTIPGHIEAVDGHTGSRQWITSGTGVLGRPGLSSDGSTLVIDGVPNYGQPGFIKGFDAATGEELWTVDLPGTVSPGERFLATDHARFTPDSSTAYVSTFRVGQGSWTPDPHSLLYAIDLTDGTAGVSCEDIRRFVAHCAANGRLRFGVTLRDASHSGETVTFDLDGAEQFVATVQGHEAMVGLGGQAGTGERTVTLIDPAGCRAPIVTTCQ